MSHERYALLKVQSKPVPHRLSTSFFQFQDLFSFRFVVDLLNVFTSSSVHFFFPVLRSLFVSFRFVVHLLNVFTSLSIHFFFPVLRSLFVSFRFVSLLICLTSSLQDSNQNIYITYKEDVSVLKHSKTICITYKENVSVLKHSKTIYITYKENISVLKHSKTKFNPKLNRHSNMFSTKQTLFFT